MQSFVGHRNKFGLFSRRSENPLKILRKGSDTVWVTFGKIFREVVCEPECFLDLKYRFKEAATYECIFNCFV